MADEADRANDTLEKMLDGWRNEVAYQLRHSIQPTGNCLNCDERLDDGRRWCDTDCRNDWERRK